MTIVRSLLISVMLGLFVASGAFAAPVDINSATADELAAALTGVGSTRAQAIVAERKAHGPFKSADDLVRVEGIGPHIVELNRDNIATKVVKSPSKQ